MRRWTYVCKQALDRTCPFETLRITTPTGEDHVEQRTLHRPERALSRTEVLLVLQELVHKDLRPDVEHVSLVLLEGVQGTNRQNSEQ